jgi:DNA mismatch repair protein MutS
VANAQVLVEETGDSLRFLHRVVSGGASRSYGIEAARLAGVPAPVLQRARQVLARIEANSQISLEPAAPSMPAAPPAASRQARGPDQPGETDGALAA